jgi:DNA-binding winged helix-turn-helix (wHTH) protein
LIALVARPNKAISKRELMAVIWPDVTVEEGSLRVQIAALRKALGDGKGGARYNARGTMLLLRRADLAGTRSQQ